MKEASNTKVVLKDNCGDIKNKELTPDVHPNQNIYSGHRQTTARHCL